MTAEQLDLLAEIERIENFIDPCPECIVGKCNCCDGRTLDHARDEIVPCPCRMAGHTKETT